MKKFYKLSLIGLAGLLAACNKASGGYLLNVDKYVAEVSDTAAVMVSGLLGGEKVDYVVSSYPVIFAAMNNENKKTNLSIYQDIGKSFSGKYNTKGFPQAGLFIKSSLEESADIDNFLKGFDDAVTDLVNGGTDAVKNIQAYSSDTAVQQQRFGYAAGVIKNVQKTNGMAFIEKKDNPDAKGFKKFNGPLGIEVNEEDLSPYYSKTTPNTAVVPSELNFNVIAPKGAPNAVFAKYASSDKLSIAAPAQVAATFVNKNADFVIFDAVNGVKQSKLNNDSYKLVRMVTFGNLYIVATGNDEDQKISDEDMIVSYGEGLVPDLAFKAVFKK